MLGLTVLGGLTLNDTHNRFKYVNTLVVINNSRLFQLFTVFLGIKFFPYPLFWVESAGI